MSILEIPEYITPKEYLEGEKLSPIKHEFVDGEVYAMAGTTRQHNTIAGNVFSMVRQHLLETPCFVYFAHVKVRVEVANCYYYPDVVVTCDERDNMDDVAGDESGLSSDNGHPNDETVDYTTAPFPKLIVEVLSDSTEAYDRGKKFTDYRSLETLEEYILIHQDKIMVERYTRAADGMWTIHPSRTAAETVHFSSVDLTLPVEALYAKVNFRRR